MSMLDIIKLQCGIVTVSISTALIFQYLSIELGT
jgi:hypothetical protein